jgi:hypothetical protein
MEINLIRDRAAIQVEITRLRRIEAKADSSIREAVARRIRELQKQVQGLSPQTTVHNQAA